MMYGIDKFNQFKGRVGSEFMRELGRRDAIKKLKQRERKAGRKMPDFCDLCSSARPLNKLLHWDHDHITGKFRGWLCSKCNLGLGYFEDNIQGLQRAIDYLKERT